MTQEFGLPHRLEHQLEPDLLFSAQVLLDLVTTVSTGNIILYAVVEAEFLILFENIEGQLVYPDILVLFQPTDLLLEALYPRVLLILVLEEFGFEVGEFLLREDTNIIVILEALSELFEILLH